MSGGLASQDGERASGGVIVTLAAKRSFGYFGASGNGRMVMAEHFDPSIVSTPLFLSFLYHTHNSTWTHF